MSDVPGDLTAEVGRPSSSGSDMGTIDDVVRGGLCVGCGGCRAATNGAIPIQLSPLGTYVADLTGVSVEDRSIGSRVCPFSDQAKNEDAISKAVFSSTLPHDGRVGRHLARYAGRAMSSELDKSSSGGLTSWFLSQLLERDYVDAVIHVAPDESGPLFSYTVVEDIDTLKSGRKSRYYPVSFGDVLLKIRGDGKRYAFVGIPCQLRAARLVADEDPVIGDQLRYFVGLVCGHLKSAAYAESLAWQVGVEPAELRAVDFRIKNELADARSYSFGALGASPGEMVTQRTSDLVGGNWGHAVFQLESCNYCDDIFAETADVVFGDAWLPKYEADWRGTNLVITRDDQLDALIRQGQEAGAIDIEILSVDDVARSQAGNFRHRRQGLAVRLADDRAAGRWAPRKRVTASYDGVPSERVEMIRARRELSAASHLLFRKAKELNSLAVYVDGIQPYIARHDRHAQAARLASLRTMGLRTLMQRALGKSRKVSGLMRRRIVARAVRLTQLRRREGGGMTKIYISLAGDYPNIGDAVIRRLSLAWARTEQPVTAYVADASDEWVAQVGIRPDDTVVRGRRGLATWLMGAIASPSRPALVLEPGEVLLTRSALRREIIMLIAFLLIKLRRGLVILPPRAVADRHEARPHRITVAVHRWSCRLADIVLWRDEKSLSLLKIGTRVPDIAFSDGAREGLIWSDRAVLAISLRGSREAPGEAWVGGVRDFARARNLKIVTFAQVWTDERRAEDLAESLGGEYIGRAEGENAHETVLRQLYSNASIVISDRLHVLILASLAGAVPLELVPDPATKVSTHFAQVGLSHVSYNTRSMSAGDMVSALDEGAAQGNEVVTAAVAVAAGELLLSRSQMRETLHGVREVLEK